MASGRTAAPRTGLSEPPPPGDGHLAVAAVGVGALQAPRPRLIRGTSICAALGSAAGGGHLAVLQWQWARAHGCPWDRFTCAYAAERGYLAVLQWARAQQRCTWGESMCA